MKIREKRTLNISRQVQYQWLTIVKQASNSIRPNLNELTEQSSEGIALVWIAVRSKPNESVNLVHNTVEQNEEFHANALPAYPDFPAAKGSTGKCANHTKLQQNGSRTLEFFLFFFFDQIEGGLCRFF